MILDIQPSRAVYDFDSIDVPGIYKLADNVPNQITISASNVTLDMNGCTVSGGTNGIVINGGLSNVTIKNGVVNAVSADGIQVGAGCSDIQILDVEVKNALRGIDFEQVTNGVIQNCDLNFSTTGLELDTCHNITVQKCTARANTHAGFDLLSSTTCSVIECSALSTGDGNSDISSEVFGFLAKDGNGNLFERCIANATQALSVTGSDSVVAGFALRGDESCTKIIDSEGANSQTNVSGVTLPYGMLVEQTMSSVTQVTNATSTGGAGHHPRWSPDGKYIVRSESGGTTERLILYEFDRKTETLTTLFSALSADLHDAVWHPDGTFIIAIKPGASNPNIILYEFDPALKTLTQVYSLYVNIGHIAAAWSPDGRYFVVSNSPTSIVVYRFDRANKSFSQVDSVSISGDNRSVNWSHDGEFVATVNVTNSELRVYQFDLATESLIEPAIVTQSVVSGGYFVEFSPDDQYIAVLREDTGVSTNVVIYSFDGSSVTEVTSAGTSTSFYGTLDWSSDGKYLAVAGGNGTTILTVYEFDRGSRELIEVGSYNYGNVQRGVGWSPDGAYIAITASAVSSITLRIVTGLNSPANNVIQNNTVYCNSGAQYPSGIGISGSSIANSILQNTAFNNPIPRGDRAPVVSSNYAFATNVFNQLFGDAPTLLQNISLSGIDLVLDRYDVPSGLNRLEALAESLIDNLL